MFYALAHFFRDRLPFIWDLIDRLNSWLFSMRFGGRLGEVEAGILARYGEDCGMKIVPMREVSVEDLAAFFASQPEEAFTFFKPHGFDAKSLKKLQRNRSFLAYVLLDSGRIAAYCFIRSFFMGKGFRGRMVGIDHRGCGLGTLMNRLLNDVGFGIGLRLFETVSKRNEASYRSAMSASDVKVVEEMEDDVLYLEIINSNK